jgi:hypothetical protein
MIIIEIKVVFGDSPRQGDSDASNYKNFLTSFGDLLAESVLPSLQAFLSPFNLTLARSSVSGSNISLDPARTLHCANKLAGDLMTELPVFRGDDGYMRLQMENNAFPLSRKMWSDLSCTDTQNRAY